MDPETLKTVVETAMIPVESTSKFVELLISLSTGALAVSITFSQEIFVDIPQSVSKYLARAWLCWIISILCGLFSAMAIDGQQSEIYNAIRLTLQNDLVVDNLSYMLPDSLAWPVLIPSQLQVICFFTAIVFSFIYARKSLKYRENKKKVKIIQDE